MKNGATFLILDINLWFVVLSYLRIYLRITSDVTPPFSRGLFSPFTQCGQFLTAEECGRIYGMYFLIICPWSHYLLADEDFPSFMCMLSYFIGLYVHVLCILVSNKNQIGLSFTRRDSIRSPICLCYRNTG